MIPSPVQLVGEVEVERGMRSIGLLAHMISRAKVHFTRQANEPRQMS